MEILKIWEMLLRRKWVFLQIFGAVMLIAVGGSFLISPIYKATAKIKMDLSVSQLKLSTFIPNEYFKFQYFDTDNIVDTYTALIESEPVIGKVVKDLNLKDKRGSLLEVNRFVEPNILSLVFGLKKGIELERWEDSEILEIRGFSTDIEEAVNIANGIVKSFAASYSNQRSDEASNLKRYFEKEIERIKEELSTVEEQKKMFEVENMAVNLDKQIELLLTERSSISSEIKLVEKSLEENRALLVSIQESLKKQPEFKLNQTTITSNALIESLKDQLYKASVELAKRLTELKEGHPEVVALKKQIEETKKTIKQEIDKVFGSQVTSRNAYYDSLLEKYSDNEISIVGFGVKNKVLMDQLREVEDQLKGLSIRKIASQGIQRQVDTLEGILKTLLQDRERAASAESLDFTNIIVVEYAKVPQKEFYTSYIFFPKRVFILILSIFFGSILGILAVFFIEYVDYTIKTPEDIKTIVPTNILSVIPLISSNGSLIEKEVKDTAFVNSFNNLRSNMKLLVRKDLKLISVTSAIDGEGKTTVSYYLARVLAENGQKVLLLDLNLRIPSFKKFFSGHIENGLTTLLREDIPLPSSYKTHVEGLDILTSSSVSEHPLKLIDSQRMIEILNDAKTKYDVVIIDTPSLTAGSEGLVISKLTDGVILVIGLMESSCNSVSGAIDLLAKAGIDINGVVINKAHSQLSLPLCFKGNSSG